MLYFILGLIILCGYIIVATIYIKERFDEQSLKDNDGR
jgi:hypothetical protein